MCKYTFHLLFIYSIDELSERKVATQSTTEHPWFNASNAIDKNQATCMRALPIGVGIHSEHSTVWWKVDLGGVYNIYSINILFKDYSDQGL